MIFRKYYKLIYHFILQNCRSTADAEDLAQEVFVKLWESDTMNIVSLKSYIFTVAKNIVIDWTRQSINKQIFETLVDEQQADAALRAAQKEEDISSEELLSILDNIAQTMPERRLEVYQLRWMEGLSRKEIAQKMGITVTTVDIHIQKVLEYLRKKVAELPQEMIGIITLVYTLA